jgi:hypothetical protein
MTLDFKCRVFCALIEKLKGIAKLATQLLCRAAANKRWVSVKAFASLAGRAQFLHLAILVAEFFIQEPNDVVSSAKSWAGTVRQMCQIKRELKWWRVVPSKHNGAPISKPLETTYIHSDSSRFGWAAVINDCAEARGF